MTIKLSSLKSNPKRDQDGDWVPAGNLLPGVRFRVRGAANPSWQIKSDQMTAKLKRKHGDNVPRDIEAAEWGPLIASELLLGWDGIDEDYTPEAALAALTDPLHRTLRVSVMACAFQLSAPDVEFVDEAAKNSGVPSGMSSSGEAQTNSSQS